jgi:hypothetical protein
MLILDLSDRPVPVTITSMDAEAPTPPIRSLPLSSHDHGTATNLQVFCHHVHTTLSTAGTSQANPATAGSVHAWQPHAGAPNQVLGTVLPLSVNPLDTCAGPHDMLRRRGEVRRRAPALAHAAWQGGVRARGGELEHAAGQSNLQGRCAWRQARAYGARAWPVSQ